MIQKKNYFYSQGRSSVPPKILLRFYQFETEARGITRNCDLIFFLDEIEYKMLTVSL